MITLTENATIKIKDLLAEENNPKLKLRVFVQGGGCSGMQTGFTMDEEQADDYLVDRLASITQYRLLAPSCGCCCSLVLKPPPSASCGRKREQHTS